MSRNVTKCHEMSRNVTKCHNSFEFLLNETAVVYANMEMAVLIMFFFASCKKLILFLSSQTRTRVQSVSCWHKVVLAS